MRKGNNINRNIILERLSGILYHFTNLESLLDIINDNWTFKLSSSDNEDEENIRHSKKYFISFTRQKDYRVGFPAAIYNSAYDSIVVRIEFNGDLLNNNFEGYAVDYFNGAKHNYFKQRKVDKVQWDNESEDRLFSNKQFIKGIDKYITRIDILCLDEEDFEEWSGELSLLLRKSNMVYIYNNSNDFIRQNNNTINKFLVNSMAKVQISENDIKQMVTEAIRKIMSGGNRKNIYDITFVSYGTNEFSKEKFIPPFMRDDINKPQHGFWGSPIDSLNGWGEWCDRENFHTDKLDKHVLFKIKKGSNIYIIDTQKDLDNISKNEDIEDMIQTIQRRFKCPYEMARDTALKFYHNDIKKIIDFNYLYKHYDGIFVTERAVNELRQVNNGDGLYWWDVESICVFNPDVIEVIKENAFDKAKVPSYINDDYLDSEYMDDDYGFGGGNKITNKMRQINKSYELYGNRNIDSDSSKLFNGEHPGVLAQGHGNNKNTKLARKYNGTIKSGLD